MVSAPFHTNPTRGGLRFIGLMEEVHFELRLEGGESGSVVWWVQQGKRHEDEHGTRKSRGNGFGVQPGWN